MEVLTNQSLLPYNTFRMDVPAKVLAHYHSIDELRQLLAEYRGMPILHVGQGSNILFTRDYDGVVLISHLNRARALAENGDEVYIEADNGLVLDELIEQVCDMGLGGLENLSHIPGTVGASAIQNVGAYGVEAKDCIVEVHTIEIATGQERVFANRDCRYGYRDSIFKHEAAGKYIVTSVVYKLEKHGELHLDYGNLRDSIQGTPTLRKVRDAVIAIRRAKLPEVSEMGSAGSFFKNPIIGEQQFRSLQQQYPDIPHYPATGGVKVPAAWLIDHCGLKGERVGGAEVYTRQPLVLVNASGHATGQDVVALAQRVEDRVKDKFGVQISPEVIIL